MQGSGLGLEQALGLGLASRLGVQVRLGLRLWYYNAFGVMHSHECHQLVCVCQHRHVAGLCEVLSQV